MNETAPSPDRPPKRIRWVARIWSVPIIVVVLLILVGNIWSELTNAPPDPYAVEDITLVDSLAPIFIAISTLGLALAWRWEKFGGIFSLVFTAVMYITLLIQGPFPTEFRTLTPYLLGLVVLIPGILFVVSGTRSGSK